MNSGTLQFSRYSIRSRLRDIIFQFPNRLLTLINAPGFVAPIDFADKVTGDYIHIRVTSRFTVITVNHRDYWFRRLTGKFDGTGYSVCKPTIEEQLCCILGDIPESVRPLSLWGRLKKLLQSIDWGCSA